MLMVFGKAGREIVDYMEDGMGKRKFDKFLVGEDPFHLAAKRFVHAVVVISEQETAVDEISAHLLDLGIGPFHFAVACHEQNWIREKSIVRQINNLLLFIGLYAGPPSEFPGKIGYRFRIVVPVAAPAVFEAGDGELAVGSDCSFPR